MSYAESAARGYTDLETVRRRLIELEKTRAFSDEDLAMLLRKSVSTNLRADFDSRTLNRRTRRANGSGRTSSGRAVIRSWTPAVIERTDVVSDDHGWKHAETPKSDDGWKQFEPTHQSNEPVEYAPSFRGVRKPTKLKRMQNRNFILAFLANLVFIPKQACCNLIGLVVPSNDRRAC